METWIALLRGINVGGKRTLPMRELVAVLTELGCHKVRTYIQSGNAVFQSEIRDRQSWTRQIADAIHQRYGFSPPVLLLTATELQRAAANNPFPEAIDQPQTLHFFFFEGVPDPACRQALDDRKAATERWSLVGGVLYLHLPDGLGRSKLGASAERLLGVTATARNYRTVAKLVAMTN